jgi:hypothetical protein
MRNQAAATDAAAAALPSDGGDGTGASAAATPQGAPTQPQPVQAAERLPQKCKTLAAPSAAAAAPAQRKRKPAAAAGAAIAAPATPPQHAPAVHVVLPVDMADSKHPPRMSKAGLLKLFDGDFFWQYTPHDVDLCADGVDTLPMTVPANSGLQVHSTAQSRSQGIKSLNADLYTV